MAFKIYHFIIQYSAWDRINESSLKIQFRTFHSEFLALNCFLLVFSFVYSLRFSLEKILRTIFMITKKCIWHEALFEYWDQIIVCLRGRIFREMFTCLPANVIMHFNILRHEMNYHPFTWPQGISILKYVELITLFRSVLAIGSVFVHAFQEKQVHIKANSFQFRVFCRSFDSLCTLRLCVWKIIIYCLSRSFLDNE